MAGKDTPLSVSTDKQTLEGELPRPINPTQGIIKTEHVTSNRLLTDAAPQSPQEKLARFFDNRPSPTDLKQRNILKDSKVAPSLQSAQAELERKRLEDELSAKLSIRPTPDELVDQHILSPDEVPNPEPPQSPQEKLTKFFKRRPSQHELEERNILKDPKVAPAIQSAKAELEKARLEDDLAKKIANRPDPQTLIKEHILRPDENPTEEPEE